MRVPTAFLSTLLFTLLSAVLTVPSPATAAVAGTKPPPGGVDVVYQRAVFGPGTREGVKAGKTLSFAAPVGTISYTDALGTKSWEYARWTGPERPVGFAATELVASWTADVPAGSWLQVEMRGRHAAGQTKWYVLGRWAYGDEDIRRTSLPGQRDADGTVSVDTFVAAAGRAITAYQLRVTLYRTPGSAVRPVVRTLGAMASAVPDRETVPVSPGGVAWGVELPVPRRSQNVHEGHYPQWDGGGEAWCSPTSTTMALGYWGRWPSERDTSWVDPSDPDPEVDYAARYTYDYAYEGTGNWPFNTAYAGRYGMEGFVTRLRSLTELERLIRAGVPVVTSQSFKAEELPGAGYSTNGHLMVIIGFTATGDVIANDPASRDDAAVRRVYPRANFENVWLRSTGSGGIVYVIHPPGHRLPATTPGLPANW
ncbi:peptidase C39 family protein [Microbispora cellulosiformans]|uniref:Peptidase C39 family protein n=1 Tax=Microbispora cellulosiformans TaxID=2614688 RepID=A0A5J5K5V8_9ACTN|nr:C39 family peptidase [Microbispora cellulosiformans]KAA9378480.1 peptidase C39 family protein [Microbispora cellulosiformans]